MNMKRTLHLIPLVISPYLLPAQLTVDNTMNPLELVQNMLLGPGITASNVLFNSASGTIVSEQAGSFNNGTSSLGCDQGVILASGSIAVANGPNTTGSFTLGGGNFGASDPDLEILSGYSMNDVARLEFDFISTEDSVWLRFAFGSEEYPEYVCGIANDAFGIFLSGPGITGPFENNAVNVAVVPGGTIPITINTVNSGIPGGLNIASNCAQLDPNWEQNSAYYVDNTGSTEIQLDGQTVAMTAVAAVISGSMYHLKLVIADGGDTAFDSAVFIAANGFTSDLFSAINEPTSHDPQVRVDALNGLLFFHNHIGSDAEVSITDRIGRTVLRERSQGQGVQPLNIAALSTGMYILHLTGQNGAHMSSKFVIE